MDERHHQAARPDQGDLVQLFVLIDIDPTFDPFWMVSPVEVELTAADFTDRLAAVLHTV